jgi:L-rhamnose mutarotase
MAKIGFRLKVREGKEEEYIREHQNVWPELLDIYKKAGFHNYSIFIDDRDLFLYCEVEGGMEEFVSAWKTVQATELSKNWSERMTPLLEPARGIGETQAPPLMKQIFYLE